MVTLSITEAEHMAAPLACQELIQIHQVIRELGYPQKDVTIPREYMLEQ